MAAGASSVDVQRLETQVSGFLSALAATVLLAWAGFALLRGQHRLIGDGHGWRWVTLAGALAAVQWPLQFWLGNPIACPIAVTLLHLIAMIGLAPDDSVLDAQVTARSLWFQRGLVSAILGTAGGAAMWALLL